MTPEKTPRRTASVPSPTAAESVRGVPHYLLMATTQTRQKSESVRGRSPLNPDPPTQAARLRIRITRDRQELDAATAGAQFAAIRTLVSVLAPFDSPDSLLQFMHNKIEDPEVKDQILRGLIVHARRGRGVGAYAWRLLICAMQPALEKHLRRTTMTADEVLDAFVGQVLHLNLETVIRVAASLARNTRRDAFAARRNPFDTSAHHVPIPSEGGVEEDGRLVRFPVMLTVWDPDPFDEPEPEGPDPDDVAALRDEVAEVVGEGDAELVIGAAIYEESQKSLADRLGIRHAAARQRLGRALKRLKRRFAAGRRSPRRHTARAALHLRGGGAS